MFKFTLVTVLLLSIGFAAPQLAQTQLVQQKPSPQKKSVYGPVVTAYLTGLNEELNELNFQLQQKEISRPDFERTRQRLLIQRRLVQERARASRADRVPELQVLQLDEFGMVGLSQPPEPERLQVGNVFDESWRLIGIEATQPVFYVFEKVALTLAKAPEGRRERQAALPADPLSVIETIVVPDPQPLRPLPPAASRPRTVAQGNGEFIEAEPAPTVTKPDQIVGPRIVRFYLPEYTEKALEKLVNGELIVTALFRRDGKVRDVTVVKGLGSGLDERAVESVKRVSFEPARIGERSVDARAEIVFNFTPGKVNARLRNAKPE